MASRLTWWVVTVVSMLLMLAILVGLIGGSVLWAISEYSRAPLAWVPFLMGVLLIMACFFCTPFFILRLLSGEISIDQVQDTIKRARLLNRICPAVACTEEDEGTACYVCCEKLDGGMRVEYLDAAIVSMLLVWRCGGFADIREKVSDVRCADTRQIVDGKLLFDGELEGRRPTGRL
eukprot:CAMPEP_0115501386 /NCGR_PEP_ID=MMETSP0271-20121206/68365_1 /TAXON_ID=71861 /ORGANISM="Scrippsiella trochoidea, Strain CCMP3099" /LENGTH=176 /DNA_ID=CAMNT_0002930307 /DNA_START=56 /DNA_END=587 /DNA_ORIENTATION=-